MVKEVGIEAQVIRPLADILILRLSLFFVLVLFLSSLLLLWNLLFPSLFFGGGFPIFMSRIAELNSPIFRS